LRKREDLVAEHRRRAEEVERQLQAFRPAQFHRVVNSKGISMTDGEIVAGLTKATNVIRVLSQKTLSSTRELARKRTAQAEAHKKDVSQQLQSGFRQHVSFEQARLEAASDVVQNAIDRLLAVARCRDEAAYRGFSPDDDNAHIAGSVPDRRNLRKLRSSLVAAQTAWEEALDMWDSVEAGSANDMPEALVPKEEATKHLQALDQIRSGISDRLAELQDADPDLYEFCMGNIGLNAGANLGAEDTPEQTPESSETWLPSGWEEYVAEDGRPYYYNKVTNLTQWESPIQDAAESAGWRLVEAPSGIYIYQNPYNPCDFVQWPKMPTHTATPAAAPAEIPATTSTRFGGYPTESSPHAPTNTSSNGVAVRDPVLDDGFEGLE